MLSDRRVAQFTLPAIELVQAGGYLAAPRHSECVDIDRPNRVARDQRQ